MFKDNAVKKVTEKESKLEKVKEKMKVELQDIKIKKNKYWD